MTLNQLGRWFQSNIIDASDWMITGYYNLFGEGDLGELTIGQVLFTLFIWWAVYEIFEWLHASFENIKRNFGNKDP